MKLKLLLALVLYGSSAYALQTAYWDNFVKAFNDFKNQMAMTCRVKEKLDNENEKLGSDSFQLSEKDIRFAWWTVQKNKTDENRKLNQIDGIKSMDLIDVLLKNQNKKKKESDTIQIPLKDYFDNVIEGIKKGKILAKYYTELMEAPDDAPPSLSRQIKTLKEQLLSDKKLPQGMQVSINWKKRAEEMIKTECLKECGAKDCEKYFEFREGSAAYLDEVKKINNTLDSMRVYGEMKEEIINSTFAQDELKKCKEGYVNLQKKATKLKSAAKLAIDSLNDSGSDSKKAITDLKTAYDALFSPKP